MATVSIRGLQKRYGGVEALSGIDLEIPDGEFTVLVGPSGCGKSTLLRTIAGLEEISDGTIAIGGEVVNDMRPRDRDVAMVFQDYALYPHMTVFHNIGFGLMARKLPKPEVEKRVKTAAKMLDIERLLDRYPRQLSGGQRQRVAIGRAIVRNPQIFLFDEPLSNLDAQLRDEMRSEIKRLHQELGTTMIYVTHDQIEAMTLADRIVLLRDGKIEQAGSPLELYERPATHFVAGFLGSPQMNFIPAKLSGSRGKLNVQLDAGESLPVPQDISSSSKKRSVILGLRPQHITRAASTTVRNGHARVGVKVELVQPTGSRAYITFPFGGTAVVAELDPHDVHKPGEMIDLDFDMNRAVLIDPETERVIRE
jgi:multiple sugar transport system ATP-binding protein